MLSSSCHSTCIHHHFALGDRGVADAKSLLSSQELSLLPTNFTRQQYQLGNRNYLYAASELVIQIARKSTLFLSMALRRNRDNQL
jgi:hypothetical protein